MPEAPWRCTQCGTVNAPSANACRACGHWPSLFDLQDNLVLDGTEGEDVVDDLAPDDVEAHVHAHVYEPETAAELDDDVAVLWPEEEPAEPVESPVPRRRSGLRIARLIVPIGVLLYVLLQSYFSGH